MKQKKNQVIIHPTKNSISENTAISLSFLGRTRTKDKYRVVYSDHQRLELEKEFHYSRYITIRRKAELAQALSLSERQVSHVLYCLFKRTIQCFAKNRLFGISPLKLINMSV